MIPVRKGIGGTSETLYSHIRVDPHAQGYRAYARHKLLTPTVGPMESPEILLFPGSQGAGSALPLQSFDWKNPGTALSPEFDKARAGIWLCTGNACTV